MIHHSYNTINYDTYKTIIIADERKIPELSNYNLLLWEANSIEESFKINWNQKNTIQTCISVSYYKLQDNSRCSFTMDLINTNNSNVEYSYTFQQAVNLFYV